MAGDAMQALHEGLVGHGLIVPTGVPGVFGRGERFEQVMDALTTFITRSARGDGAVVVNHPPVMSRAVLQKVRYLDGFPHLCGSVHSFMGNGLAALRFAEAAAAGEPWAPHLEQTEVVLSPSACYGVYPMFTGTLPDSGRLVTIYNWVFRHEPSPEPTRLMSFRMREYVKLGDPDAILAWREMWLARGHQMLRQLGLPVTEEVASDPFFGRGGKVMAASQRDQKLKFELVVPVWSTDQPTALCSFNYHQDKFGQAFDIRLPDGRVAHSACVGFGMERLAMALFRHHGFVPSGWPADLQALLWPGAPA
ncbi:amino acid--[acyl-carrier-protein] ligase [Aquabacterium fontiphilum]|uniref:amino acid--[acyl-carrier-protein] ligase n=1 Tax=Aquabacterium fontiphilum TaxID=450365 RepID=UPI001376F2BF|nr:amino acid--[acyl-carrier-protein] ligase [Aquabacterium fontiphilum]NBD21691.1 amino acid--[acyl-carrier-protein] ligase [Aquabacterium fontiphilum]